MWSQTPRRSRLPTYLGQGMMVTLSGLGKRGRNWRRLRKRSSGVETMGTTLIMGPSSFERRVSMSRVLRRRGK